MALTRQDIVKIYLGGVNQKWWIICVHWERIISIKTNIMKVQCMIEYQTVQIIIQLSFDKS